jgi:hypothetical protein
LGWRRAYPPRVDEPLLEDGTVIEGEALMDAGPAVEAEVQAALPEKGKLFADDGTFRAAVIRPCQSRGRAIKGLQPIYTPQMLGEHAGVFTNWRMFANHLAEGLAELALAAEGVREDELAAAVAEARKARSIFELGGRLVSTWYDPALTLAEDEARGFWQGGVVGRVLPQPKIREMLEADPEILSLSIAAWPKSARVGEFRGKRGAIIEGIRSVPEGSVDFVVRPGAGGRPLVEQQRVAASLLPRIYSPPREERDVSERENTPPKPLGEMTATELREHLASVNPTAFAELTPAAPAERASAESAASFSAEEVRGMIADMRRELAEEFQDRLTVAQDRASESAEDAGRRGRRLERLAESAQDMIRRASDLVPTSRARLLAQWATVPDALGDDRVSESGDVQETAEQLVAAAVREQIDEQRAIVREAKGGPLVRGQGTAQPGESGRARQERPLWREFAVSNGLLESADDDGKASKLIEEVY